MKLACLLIACGALVGFCTSGISSRIIADDEMIEYRLPNDRTVILVMIRGNATVEDAREEGRRRAAEVCIDSGHRYFVIESERETMVSMPSAEQKQFGNNLYQEMINENNFGKENQPISEGGMPTSQPVPALRVVFICIDQNSKNAIDAYGYKKAPKQRTASGQ